MQQQSSPTNVTAFFDFTALNTAVKAVEEAMEIEGAIGNLAIDEGNLDAILAHQARQAEEDPFFMGGVVNQDYQKYIDGLTSDEIGEMLEELERDPQAAQLQIDTATYYKSINLDSEYQRRIMNMSAEEIGFAIEDAKNDFGMVMLDYSLCQSSL